MQANPVISQDELAHELGYKNQSGVGNLEGRVTISPKRAAKAAAFFRARIKRNVTTDWLHFGGPEPEPIPATSESFVSYRSAEVSMATISPAGRPADIRKALAVLERHLRAAEPDARKAAGALLGVWALDPDANRASGEAVENILRPHVANERVDEKYYEKERSRARAARSRGG